MSARAARSVMLCLPLVLGGVALAQAPDAASRPRAVAEVSAAVELDRKIIADVKSKSELMKNLQYLSDVIGPRLTGSKNLEKANHWTAGKMKEYGLENVRLEPWEVPVGWERGHATMKLIEPANGRTIAVASSGWTPGTKGKVTGPVVALSARTKADLEKYKGKLKNAVVLLSPPREMQPITDLSYIGMRPNEPLDKSAGGRPSFAPKKGEAKKDEPKQAEAKKGELPLPPPPVAAGTGEPKKPEAKKDEAKKDPPKVDLKPPEKK